MSNAEITKSIIIFASGNGTNTKAIIQHFNEKKNASVNLIVCNNLNAGVLDIARSYKIPFLIIDKLLLKENNIVKKINEFKPDLIVLAGFLLKIPKHLIDAFPNKIINIHPSLLPKYGGKGMFGSHVHTAVLEAKELESGITIHYVNEKYDDGAIILQEKCQLSAEETLPSLTKKIAQLEHTYYPKSIELLLNKQ
jgi:phosphoribosylglycinamide formyltransferase-1